LKDSLQHINDSIQKTSDTFKTMVDSTVPQDFFGGNFEASPIQYETLLNLESLAPDWLSLVFTGTIVYFIIIRLLFGFHIADGMRSLLKIEILDDVSFEKSNQSFALFLAPFSIIVYAYYFYFFINPKYLKFDFDYLFLQFSAIIIGVFLLKQSLEFLISIIFNTLKSTKAYFWDHLYLLGLSSIIQLVLIILYTYSQLKFVLWIAIAILIIFFIFRLIRSFIIGYQLTSFSKSYLFLYLCSLEILPLIWIYKMILDYQ
jgi:hypothetical protein